MLHNLRSVLRCAAITCAFVACPALLADGLSDGTHPTQGIQADLEGRFPIAIPKYDGVDQLLLLSNRWVIVVTNDMDRLYDEINRMSKGELDEQAKLWTKSQADGKPHWGAYRRRWAIVDEHMAAARLALNERKLQEAAWYAITSSDDTRYAKPQAPTRADSVLISLGRDRSHAGVFDIEFAHYNYLELPQPMAQGKTYTIATGDKQRVTFTYDENALVSRAIKVNQIGYLPDAPTKRAYIGAYCYEHGPMNADQAKRFEVVDVQTGDVAYQGEVKLLERNPRFAAAKEGQEADKRPFMYGEDVYVADFTPLQREGAFFIRVPGVGRSWPFVHRADAYGPAFYTAVRGFLHQRAGVPVERKYTPWTRPAALVNPVYESEYVALPRHLANRPKNYVIFDIIGGSIDRSRKTDNVIGGWHDAADWDRNQAHYSVVFDLLYAFTFAPSHFTDGQLNIPESGNGVPDILDEARFGLEVWRQSMDERGGVSGFLETWTHPKIDDPNVAYTFSQRTRWSSLTFAAAAAQYARLVKPFNPDDAALYAEAASKAYAFGNNPANSLGKTTIHAKKNRGRGEAYTVKLEETEDFNTPYLLHAKGQMYLLTGDKSYLDGMAELAQAGHKPFTWRFSRSDFSAWIYYTILEASDALPADLVAHWKKFYLDDADKLVADLADSSYRNTWPRAQDFWLGWGANSMTNFNRSLAIAYRLTGEAKYRDAMIANLDFMLGANPMGMSWTSGMGFVYPIDFQHAMSEDDGIADPVPGITIYGINGGPIWHVFRAKVWQAKSAEGDVVFADPAYRSPPLWRRWMVHPSTNTAQCEFTVHETMAGMAFSTAVLVNEGWKPSEQLRDRLPRDPQYLFGRYYLP